MTHPAIDNWRLHLPYAELSPAQIFAINKTAAEKGNHEAAYELAWAYLQGYGVKQDLALAEHWFGAGAVSTYEKRQVAEQYLRGRYFPKNLDKVDHWYRATGDNFSLFDLAKVYRMGALAEPDTAKAVAIYLQLLKTTDGHARLAEFELGNLIIDSRYSSGDPKLDLKWARIITQELVGQEQYKLASAYGSDMDLPGTPEVARAVVRSAASYDVDLAETRVAESLPSISAAEDYAWSRLAGQNQAGARAAAVQMAATMSPADRASGEAALVHLQDTRARYGAYYRDDDPLRSPGIETLHRELAEISDPDRLLRLAFYEESHPTASNAMNIYRHVRDERVALVRLKIATQYLRGEDGFPVSPGIAAQWFSFSARAGSKEARTQLLSLCVSGKLSQDAFSKAGCLLQSAK